MKKPAIFTKLGMDTTEISQYSPEMMTGGRYYYLDANRRIYINHLDMDFIERLVKLPAKLRIMVMELKDSEMEEYLKVSYESHLKIARELLKKRWRWRDTGDKTEFFVGFIRGIEKDKTQLLRQCRSKHPPSKSNLLKIIHYFTSDTSEVYIPNQSY